MKLKKRLPALLLALFLAFSPLMLAVPAHANRPFDSSHLLNGGSSLVCHFTVSSEISSIVDFAPGSYSLVCPIELVDSYDSSSFHYFVLGFPNSDTSEMEVTLVVTSLSPLFSFSNPGVVQFDPTSVVSFYRAYVPLSDWVPGFISPDLWIQPYPSYSFNARFILCTGSVFQSDVGFSNGVFYGPLDSYIYLSSGVFSVFSGAGSWLGGAVNNMISLFYTAESGLSVLGVLAVASLALAFILLLLYLIAGWLKFR